MRKPSLCRFSLSMAGDLVDKLDAMAKAKGGANRSQTVADMVRAQLIEHQGQRGTHHIAGTITLVYDHHRRNIQGLLTDIQHDHGPLIIATMHVHLDHHNCMEVLAVRGRADAVRRVADRLIAAPGVKHGKLTVTTTGQDFEA
ncbi:MAG: nickel-responsive transcriptional regulator NikR [Lentisphaerae bacterium]|nr:nickel-responsive transcriptional regulator NikR [Lentisphaerota bacterium]